MESKLRSILWNAKIISENYEILLCIYIGEKEFE